MKSLIAILFLINCLAFFMLTHMQKQSQQQSNKQQALQGQPEKSPQPVVLWSELSTDQLDRLSSASSQSIENPQCEIIGPFDDKASAALALQSLVAESGLPEMLVIEPESAKIWLKIPLTLTSNIPDQLWSQYETKKRYKEVCMKVAYRLKFQ